MSDFNDSFYSGDFRSDVGQEFTQAERREAWRLNNAGSRDALNRAEGVGAVEELSPRATEPPGARPFDPTPTPEYLDSDEYRTALELLRKAIDAKKPRNVARLTKALKELTDPQEE